MREIVLDTETTGLDSNKDRIVEIGCIELVNRFPTGKTLHSYFNPERDMPADAFAIHGLSAEFLSDKPKFSELARDIAVFIGDAAIVAHNAEFDLGFINAELKRAKLKTFPASCLVDTLQLARRKFPGGRNDLDSLCSRLKINNSKRAKHGALLDAELLAEVYVELVGAKQGSLLFGAVEKSGPSAAGVARGRPTPLAPRLTEQDIANHRAFVGGFKVKTIWSEDYFTEQKAA